MPLTYTLQPKMIIVRCP